MDTIITIGRQFGSGGREIGIRLSQQLGIPFYDKEILREAAKKSGLCEKIFVNFDEQPKSLLYSIAMDSYMFSLPGTGASDSLEQQVYLATYNTVRQIADNGPCVMIGRCADYALADRKNVLRLFISAPIQDRIKTVAERENIPEDRAKALIQKTDKRRASYYEYYSSQKWGSVDSYDFCLNSSVFGLDGTVNMIERIIEMKEKG
jgi:cytidylate kinase